VRPAPPPPGTGQFDESRCEVHTGGQSGPIATTLTTSLHRDRGDWTIQLALSSPPYSPAREKSPLALIFTFRQGATTQTHPPRFFALAEPAPFDVRAEPATHDAAGTEIHLSIQRWGGIVYDGNGAPPREEEITPERATAIPSSVKQSVRWRIVAQGLDDQDLPDRGETVTFRTEERHHGKVLWVEAYVDTPPTLDTATADPSQRQRRVASISSGGAHLVAPQYDAAARFRFHEGILRSPEATLLLWGKRFPGGAGGHRYATTGPQHDLDRCDPTCDDAHDGPRDHWCQVSCDPGFYASPGCTLTGLRLAPHTATEAELHRYGAAGHAGHDGSVEHRSVSGPGTFCDVGVSLLCGAVYGGENLTRQCPQHGANGMVARYQDPATGWHSLLFTDLVDGREAWRVARDIADCGGFVWAGKPDGHHVFALTSNAERGVPDDPAADWGDGSTFHVGGGRPRRQTFHDDCADGGGQNHTEARFFVPQDTWDMWVAFYSAHSDQLPAEKQRARDAVDQARAALPS
jgi:hypothetical protein